MMTIVVKNNIVKWKPLKGPFLRYLYSPNHELIKNLNLSYLNKIQHLNFNRALHI